MRRAALTCLFAAALAQSAAAEPPALRDFVGNSVALTRAPGERALVVHFWATWCASCAEELPVVARAARECAEHGVRVRIAAAGEEASEVRAYLAAHALDFEPLLDPRGRAWRAAGGFGLPANWVRSGAGDRLLTGPRARAQWSNLLGELGCPFDPR